MTPGEPFLLGVNYWPRRKAMGWWAAFDPIEVREEFAVIRSLGLRCVRFFLLWESFQPSPDRVSTTALDHLRAVCDTAADLGLVVQPTFFTGHMSGPNWAPGWLVDASRVPDAAGRQVVGLDRPGGYPHPVVDVYETPLVVEAEDRLIEAVCGAIRDHPALWGWSLGNEPDLFCRPRDAATGRRWVRDRVAAIRAADPAHPVLVGLHTASLEADVGFRVDDVAAETDVSVMHGYSIYSSIARAPLDPDYVPFTAALTAALAGRPVLYEEFGVNTGSPDGPSRWEEHPGWDGRKLRIHFASEDDAAAYYAAVLPRLVDAGALGAFAWCFADYEPGLWDRPPCDHQPHERFFGLVRPDGTIKPSAIALRDFAAGDPVIREPARTVSLHGGPDAYYRDPAATMRDLYATWVRSGASTSA
ncbi:MAG TPA: hypothetical protein VH723_06390 [Candidatus Limnocylindrales bacterium]